MKPGNTEHDTELGVADMGEAKAVYGEVTKWISDNRPDSIYPIIKMIATYHTRLSPASFTMLAFKVGGWLELPETQLLFALKAGFKGGNA